MEEPLEIITEAFNKLRKSISEDALDFESTKLEDVWTAIRQIDSAQRQRQSVQNLRRVEPLLKGIEKYAKVIEVLCNGTPFILYVWVCNFDSILQLDCSQNLGSHKIDDTGKDA